MIPILNDTTRNFTTRDNLGITGATTSLQAELCPVINTVTPRAFYWPFMVWNYYEYLKYTEQKNRSVADFDKPFLKRNDYFFVLGNLLSNQTDQYNLVGKDNTWYDIRRDKKTYDYNVKYFVSRYGGMQYYNAGCDTLGFITSVDNAGNKYMFPLLTESIGKPLAIAFEDAVKDTEYYKNYRHHGNQVPVDVLIEWGNRVNLTMNHLEECKRLLKKSLFEPVNNQRFHNNTLIESSELLKYVHKSNRNPTIDQIRHLLYQDYYEMRLKASFPEGLISIGKSWEAVVARQYMAFALEIIWKSLLLDLSNPITMNAWIDYSIEESTFNTINPSSRVKDVVSHFKCNSKEIEELLRSGRGSSSRHEFLFENSLMVLFSLYNRFKNRDDIDPLLISYGEDISIINLVKEIDLYMDDTVESFLRFLTEQWVLKRHLEVARNKMYYGRDAFYFYIENDVCFLKRNDAKPDFPGLRLMQLMQVMRDLGMFYE
jgi:hypothetical protein